MKYKLKKDLPTFKAGDIFTLSDNGCLYKDIGEQIPVCAYTQPTLEKFPNILRDWFEEIPEAPKTVWDLKEGDKYYTIFLEKCGDIVEHEWTGGQTDNSLRSFGLCFLAVKEAQKAANWMWSKTILERDTKGFKQSIGVHHYFIYYNYGSRELRIGYHTGTNLYNHPAFAAEEDARALH